MRENLQVYRWKWSNEKQTTNSWHVYKFVVMALLYDLDVFVNNFHKRVQVLYKIIFTLHFIIGFDKIQTPSCLHAIACHWLKWEMYPYSISCPVAKTRWSSYGNCLPIAAWLSILEQEQLGKWNTARKLSSTTQRIMVSGLLKNFVVFHIFSVCLL